MDLATTLKDFRQDNELEQEELAKLLDTTQQTISNWETGTMPRVGALKRISHLIATYKKGQAAEPYVPSPVLEGKAYPTFNNTMIPVESLGVSESEPRRQIAASGRRAEAQAVIDGVFEALPKELSIQKDVRVAFSGVAAMADFLGTRACVEVRLGGRHGLPVPSATLIDTAIHHLNTIRAIHRINHEEREAYAVLLLIPSMAEISYPRVGRGIATANLHNVNFMMVESVKECAEMIVGLETGTLWASEPFDDDDDEASLFP